MQLPDLFLLLKTNKKSLKIKANNDEHTCNCQHKYKIRACLSFIFNLRMKMSLTCICRMECIPIHVLFILVIN